MSTRPINVAQTERLAAGILAVALLARSVKISRPLGLIAAGCLIYRALSGHCYGYEWLGTGTCKLPPKP
jgi:hypothetical protein